MASGSSKKRGNESKNLEQSCFIGRTNVIYFTFRKESQYTHERPNTRKYKSKTSRLFVVEVA